MKKTKLDKIRKTLDDMYASPHNLKWGDLISMAKKLGRTIDDRGKEPTYVRPENPKLFPPMSIPSHGKMKPNTVRSIIDALISDVDEWELYLIQLAEEEAKAKDKAKK